MITLVCKTTDPGYEFQYAKLRLTPEGARRTLAYREMYQTVQKRDGTLYCLEFFDYDVTYGASLDVEGDGEGWDRWYAVSGDPDLDQVCQASCCTMKVTDSGVLWSACPKHDDNYFETPEISWEELEKIAAGQEAFGPAPLSEDYPDDNPANPGVGCI